MLRSIKEFNDEKNLRNFVNFVCEGELAKANSSLNEVVRSKIKNLVQKNLKKENN